MEPIGCLANPAHVCPIAKSAVERPLNCDSRSDGAELGQSDGTGGARNAIDDLMVEIRFRIRPTVADDAWKRDSAASGDRDFYDRVREPIKAV